MRPIWWGSSSIGEATGPAAIPAMTGEDAPTMGDLAATLLRAHGVTRVFGIPGVHNLALFDGLVAHALDITVSRHEQGAGYMADAYSRTTGKPAALALVTGPGVLNAMTPIAQAWHDSIPMLVLSSTVASEQFGEHRGTLHDTPDIAATLRPYTVFSETVRTPEQLKDAFATVFALWRRGRPRPAYIGIPRDLLASEIPPGFAVASVVPEEPAERRGGTSAAKESLDRILKADSPVIYVGGGAKRDGRNIARLAELCDVPIVLSSNAKGAVPSRHPLNAGIAPVVAEGRRLLEEADLVVALGSELSDLEYFGGSPHALRSVLRVDLDPQVVADHPHPLSANARCAEWLSEVLESARDRADATVSASRVPGSARVRVVRDAVARARQDDPYAEWVASVESETRDEVVVAADSAQLAYQCHMFMDFDHPNRWLSSYGFGTLGIALPMAVGAAVAAPDIPVLALIGDGGLLFTVGELATARDLGRQFTVIVWDNGGYKEIEAAFEASGSAPVGVASGLHDAAQVAPGFGARVSVVAEPRELGTALRSSLRRPCLTVIVVRAPRELRVGSAVRPLMQSR